MKAAVIDSLERGPRFADFAEPVVTGGETLVEVTAAGLHPIVRMLASGEHYGSQGMLPMIPAITRRGLAHTAPRVRLVEVGQMAGPAISLPADVLRSSGLEILGSGPGTVPLAEITGAIPEFMSLAATSDLPIDIDEVPLEVEPAWHRRSGGRRIVFRP